MQDKAKFTEQETGNEGEAAAAKRESRRAREVPLWHKTALNTEETSAYAGISIGVIRLLVELSKQGKGDFPCFWVGPNIKIPRQALDRWIEEQGNNRTLLNPPRLEEIVKAETQAPKRGRPRKII